MTLEIILAVIIGLVAGGIVNALADTLILKEDDEGLLYKLEIGLPVYGDGTPRPVSAWLGIVAFLLGQRQPKKAKPNEERARAHQQTDGLTWRYPLTEIATIVLMIVTVIATHDFNGMNALQLGFYWLYMALFMLITVVDIEHKLILRIVMVPCVIIGLMDALLLPAPLPTLERAIIGGLIGFGIFFGLYLGGFLFTRILSHVQGREINTVAFGFGDVMLITFSGVVVGGSLLIILTIILTVFLGAFGAVAYLIISRLLRGGANAFTAIPYGPYIVAATILVLLFPSTMANILLGI